MSLIYGVLRGKVVERQLATQRKPHFQIRIDASGVQHRIAFNALSSLNPPEVLFYMIDQFEHSITNQILAANLPQGFTGLDSTVESISLDYIRKNLFTTADMRPIPINQPGADNDLNEKLDFYVQQAISDADAEVYAFGAKWGPENNVVDKYFGFLPGNGIHDIHMNQGNSGRFADDNGVYQDGGLFIHLPSRNRWVAFFIAFQSQSWHTDDQTGHPISGPIIIPPPILDPGTLINPNESAIQIIGAMLNPVGDDSRKEFVILFNSGSDAISLQGWAIADRLKKKEVINGLTIQGYSSIQIPLGGRNAQLGNQGGIITLLEPLGLKMHGVSYTKAKASKDGVLVRF